MKWCVQSEPKLRVDLEQATIVSTLAGLPWSPLQGCHTMVALHPMVGATLQVAKHLFSTISVLSPEPSPLTSILESYVFSPRLTDPKFQKLGR